MCACTRYPGTDVVCALCNMRCVTDDAPSQRVATRVESTLLMDPSQEALGATIRSVTHRHTDIQTHTHTHTSVHSNVHRKVLIETSAIACCMCRSQVFWVAAATRVQSFPTSTCTSQPSSITSKMSMRQLVSRCTRTRLLSTINKGFLPLVSHQ